MDTFDKCMAVVGVMVVIFFGAIVGYSLRKAQDHSKIVECGKATVEKDKIIYYDKDRNQYKVIRSTPKYKEDEKEIKEKENG